MRVARRITTRAQPAFGVHLASSQKGPPGTFLCSVHFCAGSNCICANFCFKIPESLIPLPEGRYLALEGQLGICEKLIITVISEALITLFHQTKGYWTVAMPICCFPGIFLTWVKGLLPVLAQIVL